MGQNNDISSEPSPSATPASSSIESEPDSIEPEPIPSESSSSRAGTPSSTSSESSQRRSRAGRALISPEQASLNRQQAEQARRNRSNFAIQPVLSSFYTGSAHRLHKRDLPSESRSWKDMLKHPHKQEFRQAADLEWKTLSKMKIVDIIERSQATTKPLPLI